MEIFDHQVIKSFILFSFVIQSRIKYRGAFRDALSNDDEITSH